MNCNNFEAIISDLAREQVLDAKERALALSHVEECRTCACLLADERALSRGLRSLAASMESYHAPAHLEASLLARFRERKEANPSPVVVEMPRKAWRWKAYIPQAVAAAVLLMFAVGGAGLIRWRESQAPATGNQTLAAKGSAPREAVPASATTTTGSPADETRTTDVPKDENNAKPRGGQKLSASEVALIMGGPAQQQRRPAYQNVPKNRINGSGMTQPGTTEIATDFIPVSYGDNLNEIDNGRIVRVEMPRHALAQFGIPVNMERANERIKADVLIGDDGTARAIRFVK